MRSYRNYSDQDILDAVEQSNSLAGVLKKLGLQPAGGNYANMKRNLRRLNADTSHFIGKAWSKQERLKDWSEYSRSSALKPHLISARGRACESCSLGHWLNSPIVLEVHHKDGDRTNNVLANLELLCPNCHSMTDNWRNRS